MMEDKDLRDFFAAFAMVGLIMRNGVLDEIGELSYEQADKMIAARKAGDHGIASIRRRKQ